MNRLFPLVLLVVACTGDPTDPGEVPTGETDPTCSYPDPVSPMTLNEVIPAYSWPEAITADGTNVPLDLAQVACPDLGDIDWSPFDVLLFVSLPAW